MKNAEMDREKTYELRSREVNEPPLPARVCWDLTVRDRDGEARLEDVAAEKETAEKIRRVCLENDVGSTEAPYVIEDLLADAEYLD